MMDPQVDVLTENHCKTIVRRLTNSENTTLLSYKVEPMASQTEGLIGEQHFAHISYNEADGTTKTVRVFVKILNGANQVLFEIAKSIKAYEKEAFFYEELIPQFESYQLDTAFVPKCYLCEPYTIVLGDLGVDGYKSTKKNEPLDLEHCKLCLEVIAKLHATAIIYEMKKTEKHDKKYSLLSEYGEILEDKFFSKEENGATRYLKCSLNGLVQLVDLVADNHISREQYKETLNQVLEGILERIDGERGDAAEFRSTLLHGDLWASNFLFRYDDKGEPRAVKLIDFQIIKYGPPALDVLQFLHTNTRKSFRDTHINGLLRHYYNCFTGLLLTNNLQGDDVMTESDFFKSCQVFMLPAKLQAIVDRCITFTADETFTEFGGDDEKFERFVFEDRSQYIVDAYKNNASFREIILEDMVELRSVLFGEI